MSDAAGELRDAAEQLDVLAVEVRTLQTSKRRIKLLLACVVALVVALGGFVWYTVDQFNEARITGCRNRNDSALVTRRFAEKQFAIFETATQAGDPTAGQLALLEELRDAVPKADETEFDCDGDHQLTSADYPQ